MIKRILLLAAVTLPGPSLAGMMNDDLLLAGLEVHEAEWRNTGDDTLAWKATAWAGYDYDRILLRSRGESSDEGTEEFVTELLYSRAVSPFFNAYGGWRGDFQPESNRSWATVGLSGTAPWMIETDISAGLGSSGRSTVRLELEAEWRLTHRIVLVPEIELDAYGKDDERNGIASGLSSLEMGLRLRYDLRPETGPYVGVVWESALGDTRDLLRESGEERRERTWVFGASFWF